MDKGLWVLYLAAGFLRWIDPEREGDVRTPILLLPTRLVRSSPRDPFRLALAEEEPVVNPALVVKMSNDFGVEIPPLEDIDEIDTVSYFAKVRRSIEGRPWSVNPDLAIDIFSFHKEVMYQDLKDNEDEICQHDLVRTLALGPESETDLSFEAPAEEALDELHPPEEMTTIRDADGSQRRCIVAARSGHSFVMDGPPGTGKSQTIANMVAQAIHDGRTVLFVSEKIAALEVVKARLGDSGLGEYLLELHSSKTSRREVAETLQRSLHRRPHPSQSLGAAAIKKLIERRRELSAYATAMNEVRFPLEWTLHAAIGQVASLHEAPQVAVPKTIDQSLELSVLDRLMREAEALSRAWQPVDRGEDFLWRNVKSDLASKGAQRTVSDEISRALQALSTLGEEAARVAEQLELWWSHAPGRAANLVEVLHHLRDRHQVPERWLTRRSIEPIRDRVAELRGLVDQCHEAEKALNFSVGDEWKAIDSNSALRLANAEAQLRELEAEELLAEPSDPDHLRSRVEFVQRSVSSLKDIEIEARDLAAGLGLTAGLLTVAEVRTLVDLSDLIGSTHPPETEWIDPIALPKLEEARSVLTSLVESYRDKARALRATFKGSVIDLDLEALHARFTQIHRGLRKLGSAYRHDKRLLSPHTLTGKVIKETIALLPSAIEWQNMARELSTAEEQHAAVLGDYYYRGSDTDFGSVSEAIDVARRAVDLAGQRLEDTARFRSQLGRVGDHDGRLRLLGAELGEALETFVRESRVLPSALIDITDTPIGLLNEWLAACSPGLGTAYEQSERLRRVAGRVMNLEQVREILAERLKIEEIETTLANAWNEDRELLGSSYEAVYTDWDDFEEGLDWASRLRELLTGPVDEVTANRLVRVDVDHGSLESAVKSWWAVRDRVVGHFEGDRAATLVSDMDSSFVDANELLKGLLRSVGTIDDWVAFSDARNRLASLGVADPVEELIANRVRGDQVVPAIRRAVFEAWIDAVLSSDPRLEHFRSEDRDAFVAEFRELDRRLIETRG